jgi:Fic family protein
MKNSDLTENSFGHLVPTVTGQMAFVPDNLPPHLKWSSELVTVLSDADRAIGQLHGIGLNLPNPNLLITPFVRREAEMSSRIEGTQASIEQLYLFEMDDRAVESKVPDVREVANYVRALEYGLKRGDELPVCLRMLRELHEILLKDVRGEQRAPGQFRKVQNWIGTRGCPIEQANYIPPPPEQMITALGVFEQFINSPLGNFPVLVWLAMVHYQFEAIHPFLDGNGRIGRLLITLLICIKEVLDKPLLYLSAYFERNRREYYERLLQVSTHGRWTEWIFFFLRGVIEQSRDAFERARQLMDLQQEYHRKVHGAKRSALQIRLVDLLVERPVVTTVFVGKFFNVTYATAKNNIAKLVKLGILKQTTGARRNRVYMAEEVLKIIAKPSFND